MSPAKRSIPARPARARAAVLFVSCEHGGNDVPAAFRGLFAGRAAREALSSHRGWDPGALELGRALARGLGARIEATTVSRLLVEGNRTPGHPRFFSEFTRDAEPALRDRIERLHWAPHRKAVERAVARLVARGRRVVHVASHSFTPVWEGCVRDVDVGLLHDPRRPHEAEFVRAWRSALLARNPALKVRLNRPYRGWTDGLPTTLRGQHPASAYSGVELEVNQRFPLAGGAAWRRLVADLVASCPVSGEGARA